jgi:methylmalonyl-CoA mutase
LKHDGTLPLIGVNTFLSARDATEQHMSVVLIRSTEDEKDRQVAAVRGFNARNAQRASAALSQLQNVCTTGGNVFAELINSVKSCSLGQISRALYEVGGQYRRNV